MAVPQEVQCPAYGISEHVWHEPTVECRVGALILEDVLGDAPGIAKLGAIVWVDCKAQRWSTLDPR